jgi:flagellar P-ring protein precursor FlgI
MKTWETEAHADDWKVVPDFTPARDVVPAAPAELEPLFVFSPARDLARAVTVGLLLAIAMLVLAAAASSQETRVKDLTVRGGDVPFRLVGYGLVTGLDGTGDRVVGSFSAGHTVRSVANLLRRFDVEVPEHMLRTRNVAAVLVTSEVSPYLRPGGRFDVHVSSVGDATSLRGGVLWMTPLQAGPNAPMVATAQGALLVSEGFAPRGGNPIETTVTLPSGGLLEQALPAAAFAVAPVLYLREPDLQTAIRIADAVNAAIGQGAATVDDPGSVTLQLGADPAASAVVQLAQIGELTVERARRARVIIDARAGTVIAGGDIRIGEAVVSHGAMTLAIGGAPATDPPVPGDLRIQAGATVQDVAGALHAVAAPPESIGAVFESLREVGALTAEVTVR